MLGGPGIDLEGLPLDVGLVSILTRFGCHFGAEDLSDLIGQLGSAIWLELLRGI